MKNNTLKLISRFGRDESGVAGDAIGVVTAAIVIAVGALVFYQLMANMPVMHGNRAGDSAVVNATADAYNTTQTNIRTNTNTGINLLTIGLIIAGAVAILLLVVRSLGGLGGGGGL